MKKAKSRAVFLDRDGTLIIDRNYPSDPDEVEFLPGVFEGLRELQRAGYSLVLVSNQSGVGRGFFTIATMRRVSDRFEQLLLENGVEFAAMYYCPHAPEDGCECRKPATGMIDRAVKEHNIKLKGSYVVGDKASDAELGKRAGLVSILLNSSGQVELSAGVAERGIIVVDNFVDAVERILNLERDEQ